MFIQSRVVRINNKTHNTSWFKILENNAYAVEQGNLYSVQDEKSLIKTYSSNNIRIIKSSNCLLVGNDILGYDVIHKNQSIFNEQKLKGFKLPFDSRSSEIYFFRRDRKSKKYQSGLYDSVSKSLILNEKSILNINFIDEDFYLTANNERIDKEGNYLWKLSLNQFEDVELKKIIGIYQHKLLVACENHLLLSIDTNTGEVLQQWKEFKTFDAGQEYKNVLPESEDFILDKDLGKLIGVFSKYYFEIDLQSGEISYEDIQEELKQHNVNSFRRMGNNPLTRDHIFVTAHAESKEQPNVDLDCILALNRKTKKVDWIHLFENTGIGTNIPQITNDYLYQLDLEGGIHIFEKK